MLLGDDLTVCRVPKSGSTTMERTMVSAGLVTVAPGPSHTWLADFPRTRHTLSSVRHPLAWHVSHFWHWFRAGPKGGADRLDYWTGGLTDCDDVAGTWGRYLRGARGPARVGADLDAWPKVAAWPKISGEPAPGRWMTQRACGLLTWAYVHHHYPRECWGWSIADLIERHDEMVLPDAFVHSDQMAAGLADVGRAWGWPAFEVETVNVAPPKPEGLGFTRRARLAVLDAERLVLVVHPWDEMPAVRWRVSP